MTKSLMMVALTALACAFAATACAGTFTSSRYDALGDALPAQPTGIAGGPSGTFRITAAAGFGINSLSGQIQQDTDVVNGTKVDLEDTLGLDGGASIRADVLAQIWIIRVGLGIQPISFEGSKTLKAPVTFAGTTYAAGGELDTTIDANLFRVELGITPLSFGGFIELGIGIGVNVFDMDFKLEGEETPGSGNRKTESKSLLAPAPVIAVHAGIFPGFGLSIEPQVGLLYLPEIAGIKGFSYDINVMVKYYIIQNLSVGVRLGGTGFSVDADVEENKGDTFTGSMSMGTYQIELVVGASF